MKAISTVGPLTSILEQYDDACMAAEDARLILERKKWQLCQFAIDQNMLDVLTVNVNKLRKYRD
jgi:hypothetical protein